MMKIRSGCSLIGIPQNKFTIAIQSKKKTNQESCAIAVRSKQESMTDVYFVIFPPYKYSHKRRL
jgi:hypothetical protein